MYKPSQLLRPSWAADNPGGSWQASPSRAGQGVDRLHRQQLCWKTVAATGNHASLGTGRGIRVPKLQKPSLHRPSSGTLPLFSTQPSWAGLRAKDQASAPSPPGSWTLLSTAATVRVPARNQTPAAIPGAGPPRPQVYGQGGRGPAGLRVQLPCPQPDKVLRWVPQEQAQIPSSFSSHTTGGSSLGWQSTSHLACFCPQTTRVRTTPA